jgi:hypothetical protein
MPHEDIRRQDARIFTRGLVSFRSVICAGMGAFFANGWLLSTQAAGITTWTQLPLLLSVLSFVGIPYFAYRHWQNKKFMHRRFAQLWENVVDRRIRLEEALTALRRTNRTEFSDLPRNARRVSEDIYAALRRADLVMKEIMTSEHRAGSPGAPNLNRQVTDPQSQTLYQVAERNLVEYRLQYRSVLGGVERAEAQAVAFITTMDTLRIRALRHRLGSRLDETELEEFLGAIKEAKLQFDAIDQALDELERGVNLATFGTAENPNDIMAREFPVDTNENPREELAKSPPPIPPDARRTDQNQENR